MTVTQNHQQNTQDTAPQQTIQNEAEVAVKRSEKPLKRTRRKSTLSISSHFEEKKKKSKEKELDLSNMPKDPFEYEELLKLWNNYASTLLEQGKTLLHPAMVADKPRLEGDTIHFDVPNKTLSAQFAEDNRMIQYIRENLNNYSLKFKTHITETENLKLIFTSKEKYNFMLEKNPLLEQLVTKLMLELV